jgi:hypothetical protein
MDALTDTQLAYLAGFFDGEGCICISKGTLSVAIAQVAPEMLYFIRAHYGGCIVTLHKSAKNPKWHDAEQWTAKTRGARMFLLDILPYLVIKKEEAEKAIEHQEYKSSLPSGFANPAHPLYGKNGKIHPVEQTWTP